MKVSRRALVGRDDGVRMFGIPVANDDCKILVDLLMRVGRVDDLAAAATIEHGLKMEAQLIALPIDERDAILGALDDPPDGLAELRGVLERDNRDRTQGPSSF